MNQITEFGLTLSDWPWVLAAAGGLVYLAWQIYRPSGGSRAPAWLLPVRLAALLLMAGLLLEPIAAVTTQGTRKPLLALMVDDSASMRVSDSGTPRWQVAADLAEGVAMERVGGRARVSFFRFSDTISDGLPDPQDTTAWRGRATNLAQAMDGLAESTAGEGLVGVLLVTDGGHNLGGQPSRAAAELGVPVYPIAIGSPTPPEDVALESGAADPVAYVGQDLDLTMRVVSSGFDGMPHTLIVQDGDGDPVRHTLTLAEGEQVVAITVRPVEAGRRVFRISLPPLAGEHSAENNVLFLSTDVLEGKKRVFVAAGRPSPDLAYFRRLLEADPNVEVEVSTYVRSGSMRGKPPEALRNPDRFHLVVLFDLPGQVLESGTGRSLLSYVQRGGSLLVVGGMDALNLSYYKTGLTEALPVAILPESSWRETVVTLRPAESALDHPILRRTDPLTDRQGWSDLPPVLAYNRTGALQQGSESLLVHPLEKVDGQPMALSAVRRFGKGKTMVMAARTFWRLGPMMQGIGKTDAVSRAFWSGAVKWLVTQDDMARVRTQTDRTVYRSGEPVQVMAQVFSDLMEPVDGARVMVEVTPAVPDPLGVKPEPRQVLLSGLGKGRYTGPLGGYSQGDYSYTVTATAREVAYGDAAGRFTVGRYSLEFENVRMREELLRDVADRSGGLFLTPETAPAFLETLTLPEQPVTGTFRARLWGSSWPLYVLVALFSLEWAVRRRRGMV